jgi:mono/diheme cytochrome c family protein
MFRNILDKLNNKLLQSEPRSGELYAATALFDSPDKIINAANTAANAGYKKFDVLTPYPVHGMDQAMKMKETKVGWVALAAGLFGTTFAFLIMMWMVGFDYRNIIGGKPFFNVPPSIPIMFEVTVLLASLTVTGAMLALFNRLPANSDPLQDSNFLRRTTSDMFGLYIAADDPKFNYDEVKKLFSSLDAAIVEDVYCPVFDKGKTINPLKDFRFIRTIILTAIITSAATYFILNILLYLPPFSWMHEQHKTKPQTFSGFFSDGYSNRVPVGGTVARNFIPYEFKGLPDSLLKPVVNPLPPTQEVIERGKNRFNIYCSPCHGYYGKGDSRLRGQFPIPPTLHSEKVRNWKDYNIYHVITNGQNNMPSYERQIPRDDRWAIIHYLRVLQRSQNALDSDLGETTDTTKVKTDSLKTEVKKEK